MPYHSDPWLTVYQGDCREVMAAMEPGSVHCVVTSPPYWGLRDYGTATWIGGDESCDHSVGGQVAQTKHPAEGHATGQRPGLDASRCRKCGAIRQDSQLGLEPTPEEYVANMVDVFREVRRVLRDDGTCWVNLGDSYSGAAVGIFNGGKGQHEGAGFDKRIPGLKPKDLVGIPWRVAFALQADGWYLRSDIIWAKPNPMPESVTDRPTKAHEYVFLLSKQPRYWYDAEAVREPHDPASIKRAENPRNGHIGEGKRAFEFQNMNAAWDEYKLNPAGRNLRSVWSIATQPYPGAHFATFPEKLVEPCIKAGCPDRVCSECGRGWERQIEPSERYAKFLGRGFTDHAADLEQGTMQHRGVNRQNAMLREGITGREVVTTGWSAACTHDAPTVRGIVLDPFAGSGTTGRVAQRLSRRAVLIDLNGEYLVQAMERNRDLPLGLESA